MHERSSLTTNFNQDPGMTALYIEVRLGVSRVSLPVN